MIVLLWEMGDLFSEIVLWDGLSTFWHEGMRPSHGYDGLDSLRLNKVCKVTGGRYTLIGVL